MLILRKQKQEREKKNESGTADSAPAKTTPHETAEAAPFADQIDLRSVLNEEEIRLLGTDLSCMADKLQAQGVGTEEINVVRAVCELVSVTGRIPKQALQLCVLSAQDMIDGFASTFGLSRGDTMRCWKN